MHQHNGLHGLNDVPNAMANATASNMKSDLALAIIQRIAQETSISIDLLLSPSRGKQPVAEARQHAMYLAHVAAGFTMSAVGDIFGRDRTTIRHACACVEDRRDDVEFDTYISQLEAEIEELRGDRQ